MVVVVRLSRTHTGRHNVNDDDFGQSEIGWDTCSMEKERSGCLGITPFDPPPVDDVTPECGGLIFRIHTEICHKEFPEVCVTAD